MAGCIGCGKWRPLRFAKVFFYLWCRKPIDFSWTALRMQCWEGWYKAKGRLLCEDRCREEAVFLAVLVPSACTLRSSGSSQKQKLGAAVDHVNDWQCLCQISCQNFSPGGAKSSNVVFFILFNIDASCTVSCNIAHIWFSHSQKTFLSLLLDYPKARSKPLLWIKILLLPLALVSVRV